jgi:hypothetical protein
MSVAETCTYYASLVLPSSVGKAGRAERISQVLAALGLSHTTHTLVSMGVCSVEGQAGGRQQLAGLLLLHFMIRHSKIAVDPMS